MWTVALLAGVAMVLQDVLGVLLTQAEARDKAILAGILDSVGWLAAIATTTLTVTVLQGHSTEEKIVVILVVTLANFVGTVTGTLIGKKYIKSTVVPRSRID